MYGKSIVYAEGSPLLYGISEDAGCVRTTLGSLGATVAEMRALFDRNDQGDEGTLAAGLNSFREVVQELQEAFEFLVSAADEEYVYYLRADNRGDPVALTAQPVDVSSQLGALLEECGQAQVLTSATLAVDGDFSYLMGITGIVHSDRAETHRFETPFDLKKQRALLLAAFMPAPGSSRFTDAVGNVISAIARRAPRNLLVLCTSREQVKAIHAGLSQCEDLEPLLLSQLEGASRSRLTEEFTGGTGKILLGLASFWEGVDFPGELLEIVVIVKMPFMVPFEPIVRARADKLQRAGENPFQALFLPDAALKLKQGAGRLIRTSSDKGVVIVLDSRLGEKSYGPSALRSISGEFVRCDDQRTLLAEIDAVFSSES
jgi:ATP-dependent DNA helicase DinG